MNLYEPEVPIPVSLLEKHLFFFQGKSIKQKLM